VEPGPLPRRWPPRARRAVVDGLRAERGGEHGAESDRCRAAGRARGGQDAHAALAAAAGAADGRLLLPDQAAGGCRLLAQRGARDRRRLRRGAGRPALPAAAAARRAGRCVAPRAGAHRRDHPGHAGRPRRAGGRPAQARPPGVDRLPGHAAGARAVPGRPRGRAGDRVRLPRPRRQRGGGGEAAVGLPPRLALPAAGAARPVPPAGARRADRDRGRPDRSPDLADLDQDAGRQGGGEGACAPRRDRGRADGAARGDASHALGRRMSSQLLDDDPAERTDLRTRPVPGGDAAGRDAGRGGGGGHRGAAPRRLVRGHRVHPALSDVAGPVGGVPRRERAEHHPKAAAAARGRPHPRLPRVR
jgi:hypothetical protein